MRHNFLFHPPSRGAPGGPTGLEVQGALGVGGEEHVEVQTDANRMDEGLTLKFYWSSVR